MVTVSRPWLRLALVWAGAWLFLSIASPASAQLGSLVSPGPLSKAHAKLEGLSKCQDCHERGRQVSAARCLNCHKPVAERIQKKLGVHRNVTTDCVSCHIEHAGVDGEMRPFDQSGFQHDTETRFKLDGKHAPVAGKCAACHKGRSFLAAKTECASCHTDVHKGELGTSCERCHSTRDAFKDATRGFDHGVTRFPLTGAHQTTECASCHKTSSYKVASFSSCANCHTNPHPPKSVAGACTSCHTTSTWTTRRFDHSTTPFPLVGKHTTATCASCHKVAATRAKPASSTCAACHTDSHKGEFKQDCDACHTEDGFAGGKFDHATTRLPLTDGHAKPTCQTCHTGITTGVPATRAVVDFRGTQAACVTCHADPHTTELGNTCETCHSARTFKVDTYTHRRPLDLFGGQHAPLACEKCHTPAALPSAASAARATVPAISARGVPAPPARGVPPTPARGVPVAPGRGVPVVPTRGGTVAAATVRVALGASHFATTPTACASCHRDVHLGQVGADCERCHTVAAVKFAADRFRHDATRFTLTGAHVPLTCEKCHATETATFAGGTGTAVRLAGVSSTCDSCHRDVHLGQVERTCETCHDTSAFTIRAYTHRNPPRGFFVGPHVKAECAACHKSTTGRFPAGRGTAIAFKVGTECVRCHEDVHRGSLGTNCRDCHKLTPLAGVHQPGIPRWFTLRTVRHPGVAS